MRVYFTLARGLDREEYHVTKPVNHRRLDPVRLRRWHATERFQRQHHVAQVINGVIDVLPDFHVAFPAACELMIEGVRKARQLFLWNQVVRDTA